VTAAGLLSPRRVLVPLEARSLPEAVMKLVAACAADGMVGDATRLESEIAEASPEDTLTVGADFFLPHFRTTAVSSVVVALGIAPKPILRSPKARRRARGVLLVIAPVKEAAAYLQTVAAFARVLADADSRKAIFSATSPEEVLAVPALRDLIIEGPLRVGDIMAPVISIAPETSLGDAAALMVRRSLEALPVVGQRNEVLGIVSQAELLDYLVPSYVQQLTTGKAMAVRKLAGRVIADPRELPVREAMRRNVICVDEHQTVAEAAALMAHKDLDRIPVVKEGALVGILVRSDLVRKVIGSVKRES